MVLVELRKLKKLFTFNLDVHLVIRRAALPSFEVGLGLVLAGHHLQEVLWLELLEEIFVRLMVRRGDLFASDGRQF